PRFARELGRSHPEAKWPCEHLADDPQHITEGPHDRARHPPGAGGHTPGERSRGSGEDPPGPEAPPAPAASAALRLPFRGHLRVRFFPAPTRQLEPHSRPGVTSGLCYIQASPVRERGATHGRNPFHG